MQTQSIAALESLQLVEAEACGTYFISLLVNALHCCASSAVRRHVHGCSASISNTDTL
jgi:hypothetical protein